MGWYEGIQRLNKKIDELEKEVRSLKDEMASLKSISVKDIGKTAAQYIAEATRANGSDYLATGDIVSKSEQ